jgi:uncharacterized protein (DUF1697 family)
MADLRELLESLSFTGVRTYVQSGNAAFAAAGRVAPEAIGAALASRFGFEIPVVLRTASELRRVVAGNPFGDVPPTTLHVGFLASRPPAPVVAALGPSPYPPEEYVIAGAEVYLHLPAGMGQARLPGYLDRRLPVPVTVRNWNTVTTLVEMAGG